MMLAVPFAEAFTTSTEAEPTVFIEDHTVLPKLTTASAEDVTIATDVFLENVNTFPAASATKPTTLPESSTTWPTISDVASEEPSSKLPVLSIENSTPVEIQFATLLAMFPVTVAEPKTKVLAEFHTVIVAFLPVFAASPDNSITTLTVFLETLTEDSRTFPVEVTTNFDPSTTNSDVFCEADLDFSNKKVTEFLDIPIALTDMLFEKSKVLFAATAELEAVEFVLSVFPELSANKLCATRAVLRNRLMALLKLIIWNSYLFYLFLIYINEVCAKHARPKSNGFVLKEDCC